ncbi:MAG: HAMP domain-containing histidine kinase [Candidatus Moranbacteria bacterium]|nr:HAMP domain-containing histidine kinase [Candidatus Moranbacteria bacterium]
MGILLLPLIVLLPTHWNLSGFDQLNCEAQQGSLVQYFYFFQSVTLLWILAGLARRYLATPIDERMERNKVAIFSLGIFLFLLAFSWGNLFGSLTLQWEFEQYGLFGMPVFISFLAFLIVKYNVFDIKLIGAQALVFALVVLIGSQFFFIHTTVNFILTGVTFLLVAGFGYFLIRSVKEEVWRKEELQEMATKLALTNEELRKLDNTKSEFISIASHQLRTPLTAIKGFLSLVLEGSYGKLSAEVEDVLNKVYSANNHLVELVENLLNISRIESGRIQYVFAKADIAGVIHELADAFSVIAKGRNLKLDFVYPETPISPFLMDSQKIREVISNMIDNALKYTQQGSITVRLTNDSEKVRVSVKDTGVGIAPEDLNVLFQKFRRGKESGKVNVSGTGLGLYVGKSFAEAHGGRIFVESDGVGKGSTFTLELPFRTEDGLGAPESRKS